MGKIIVSLQANDFKQARMKRIVIENFGPLSRAEVELGRLNLIVGVQSSGKSCVMMVACYCSWVEKRIALRQSAKEFEQGSSFIDMLTSYYHAKGYTHGNTYIEYESACMKFSYDHASGQFSHRWKSGRWNYRRPKVSYVPAERNMIAVIENWERVETSYYSILDFKTDWDVARRFVKQKADILSTGVSYRYDEKTDRDLIITPEGKELALVDASSGMQSLIPQLVHLDYLCSGIYEAEKQNGQAKNYSEKQLRDNLLEILYKRSCRQDADRDKRSKQIVVHKNGKDYIFHNEQQAECFEAAAVQFLNTDHAEVFLEEPESNLFAPTQIQLMDWIVEKSQNKNHDNFFFIATHSPYILTKLLEEERNDLHLFFTYLDKEGMKVRTASDKDIEEIYNYGVDMFFNYEAFL